MSAAFEPMFIDVGSGSVRRRFALHHPPASGIPRGLVLYVHPFAEEMNKSRRMAAQQARTLAARGFAVLQPDLLGCGDSAGDFGDAQWAHWVGDVIHSAEWLRERYGRGVDLPMWFWGLRAGALLAAEAASHVDGARHFLFWQPSTTGRSVLQQFLRLKVASELLAGQAKGVIDQLRAELDSGRPVEVSGYTLHPELCRGLDRAELKPPATPGRLEWFEVQPREGAALSPLAASATASWSAAGWHARARTVAGPSFWQTTEIEDAPALLAATTRALCEDDTEAADNTLRPGADLPGTAKRGHT